MNDHGEIFDATSSLRRAEEIRRTSATLRRAYLQANRKRFLEGFESYRLGTGRLDAPDLDFVETGFRAAFASGDFQAVLKVGGRLSPEFLARHREMEVLYFVSRARVEKP